MNKDDRKLIIYLIILGVIILLIITSVAYGLGKMQGWEDVVSAKEKSILSSYIEGTDVDFYDKDNNYIISCKPYYNHWRP